MDGKRRAGSSIVSNFETIEAKPLPPGTSAQLAELIAPTQALQLGKGKKVAIYNDSKNAFLVLHVHAAVLGRKATRPHKYPQSNMVIKSLGSWRQSICLLRFQSPVVKDTKNTAALQNNDLIGVATLVPQTNLPETASYSESKTLKAKSEGFQEDHMGWSQKEGLLFLPGNLQW